MIESSPVNPCVYDVDGHVLAEPSLQRATRDVVRKVVEDGSIFVSAPFQPSLSEAIFSITSMIMLMLYKMQYSWDSYLSVEIITKPEKTMIAKTVERSSKTLYSRRWNAFPKLDCDDDNAITAYHFHCWTPISSLKLGEKSTSVPHSLVSVSPAFTARTRIKR